jgi:hypothetical protein
VPRGEAQPRPVVLEHGEARGLRLFCKAADVVRVSADTVGGFPQTLLLRQLAGEVVILAEVVPVLAARVRLPADGFDDVLAVEHADEAIDARRVVQELRLVPLHETAGDDNPLALSRRLQLDGLADLLERFVLRRLEEAAGVDDDRVGAAGVGRDRQPVLGEEAEHPLAVDEVLRTAEADERDGTDRLGLGRSGHNGPAIFEQPQSTASPSGMPLQRPCLRVIQKNARPGRVRGVPYTRQRPSDSACEQP